MRILGKALFPVQVPGNPHCEPFLFFSFSTDALFFFALSEKNFPPRLEGKVQFVCKDAVYLRIGMQCIVFQSDL